ncbi:RING finger protein 11-like [Oscarella lobularis]|uniref:RING finger protein 11-like n=1 Tax=Oscarella lobularis TaxID=121494 RepID=UPI003313C4C9
MGNCVKRERTEEYAYGSSDSGARTEDESGSRQLLLGPPPPYEASRASHPPPPSRPPPHVFLSEESRIEYVQKIQRFAMLQHLPTGKYDVTKESKRKECPICMMDFAYGDPIRLLPCMHIYHRDCVDDWLLRSFTCPMCMEPVDMQILQSLSTSESEASTENQ